MINRYYKSRRKHNKFGNKKYRLKVLGYYRIYKPYFKYCDCDGYVLEHRYIYHIYLSIKYNRIIYLPIKYDLHHKNRNTLDNRIENLQLLTRKNHMIEHDLFNGTKTKKDMLDRRCKDCNSSKTFVRKRGNKLYPEWSGNDKDGFRCRNCHRKELRKKNKKN